MYKKRNWFKTFVSYFLILIVLAGVLGLLSFFTNGFTEPVSNVSVEYNGKILSKNKSSLELTLNNDIEFKINYLNEPKDYNVEVVPCGSFSYVVNGSNARYEKIITEISDDYYCVSKTEDSFVLRLNEFNIKTILKDYHLDSEIVFDDNFDIFGSYYALLISFEGENESYKIPFDILSPVESVDFVGDIVI